MQISPKGDCSKKLQADYTYKQCYLLPCSTELLRAGVEALAASSSGSRVWGCWAAPGGPTSWCWRGRYCGRRGEAGCGRWAPPSWPSPQRVERGSGGETGAETIKGAEDEMEKNNPMNYRVSFCSRGNYSLRNDLPNINISLPVQLRSHQR